MIGIDTPGKGPSSSDSASAWRLVCVTGMMRTGSSALTRGLAALGLDLGGQAQKREKGVNPTGFWEDARTFDALHRVYRAIGLGEHMSASAGNIPDDRWRRPKVQRIARHLAEYFNCFHHQSEGALCAVKNPSIGRLIPFWLRVMELARCSDAYIVTIRSPEAVAASCGRAWNFPAALAHGLWVQFTLGALVPAMQGRPTILIDYDAFMLDPTASLHRIATWADIPMTPDIQDTIDDFARRFIRRDLQHFVGSAGTNAPPLLTQMYQALRRAAVRGDAAESEAFQAHWQQLAGEAAAYTEGLDALDQARRKVLAKRIYWRGHSAVKDSIARLKARAAGRIK